MSGIARIRNKKITFAPRKRQGEMLEWLKRHAWKACKRRNRFGGSNPPLSAGRVGFKAFLRKICLSPQVEWDSNLFFEKVASLRRYSGIQIFSSKGLSLSAGGVGFKSFLRKVCRSPQAEPKMVSHIHYYIYSQNLDLS